MMRPIYIVLSLLFFSCNTTKNIGTEEVAITQDIDHLYIQENIDFIELDKFGNLYWVNDNQLQLKDFGIDRQHQYENDRLGKISSIDVSNPQKILVFYDDFDVVISLDNTLGERSRIDLKQFDYSDINAVGLSNDNNIWLYDPISFQLKKVNEQGKVLAESLNLNSIFFEPIEPIKILEKNNQVYLNSPMDGILIFDNLGQYIKTIPLTEVMDFQIVGENLVYTSTGGVYSYSSVHFDKFQVEALDESRRDQWKQVRLGRKYYYLAFANGIQKSLR